MPPASAPCWVAEPGLKQNWDGVDAIHVEKMSSGPMSLCGSSAAILPVRCAKASGHHLSDPRGAPTSASRARSALPDTSWTYGWYMLDADLFAANAPAMSGSPVFVSRKPVLKRDQSTANPRSNVNAPPAASSRA